MMSFRLLLMVLFVGLFLPGCGNTLNPFCGSARPAPLIGSLSPSTVTFAEVQQGVSLTVNRSHFVSATEVVINDKPLGPIITSSNELQILLTSDVISGAGKVSVSVLTPAGNSGDLGCDSGGKSSVLVLTVN